MGVKKSARGKSRATKRSPKQAPVAVPDEPVAAEPEPAAPADPPAEPAPRTKFTRNVAVGVGLLAIAVVASIAMFSGRDAGQRAEAAAVAAQPDSPALEKAAPAKPVRAVPGKKSAAKPRPADAPPAPKTAAELPDDVSAVTIEGCLEQNGAAFRLKNTSGESAPKARSWRSGFLKKGNRPVDVVDWNNRLKNHVGERISVSGMFVDGDLRVRNLRRVATTCN
jgi:hypothetical protein